MFEQMKCYQDFFYIWCTTKDVNRYFFVQNRFLKQHHISPLFLLSGRYKQKNSTSITIDALIFKLKEIEMDLVTVEVKSYADGYRMKPCKTFFNFHVKTSPLPTSQTIIFNIYKPFVSSYFRISKAHFDT